MSKCIVFLGPPGSGKGTQAARVVADYNIKKISMGDIIREKINSGTEFGEELRKIVTSGQLVNDDVVNRLVRESIDAKLKKNGFICDGYPRTYSQAVLLDELADGIKMQIYYLNVELDDLKKRILGRSVCSKCKQIYHNVTLPSKADGICDTCGSELTIREDDTEEVLVKRYTCFVDMMKPVLDYYGKRVILIDGTNSSEEVYSDICNSLNKI